ncbi:MAG: hypothetical protein WCK97_10060, partial [Actinomycetes bacterium]
GRMRSALSRGKLLATIAYRDPVHVSERLTLFGANNLAEPSQRWAERVQAEQPDASRAQIAETLRTKSAHIARVDGALSGTPFLIALAPAYMAYLWQEGRMVLRTAALYGRDPSALTTSAETLVLRGVHPTVDVALAALERVRDIPMPGKPESRRPLKVWVSAVYSLMIFGGFLSAPGGEKARGARARLKATIGIAVGLIIWVSTWVFPVTFMIVMAWGCESHARQLGNRAAALYGGEVDNAQAAIEHADNVHDKGHDRRGIVRTVFLGLSLAIPLGIVAGVIHLLQNSSSPLLMGVGALVAVSVVVAVGISAGKS